MDVIFKWHDLPLSERRKIAARYGVAPQGTRSSYDWTMEIIEKAAELGQVFRRSRKGRKDARRAGKILAAMIRAFKAMDENDRGRRRNMAAVTNGQRQGEVK